MEKSRTVYANAPGAKATAELVIQDFLDVMTTSEPKKSYASDVFMVGNNPMAVRVYPNGYDAQYKGYVSIFLENRSKADVTVKYQFIADGATMSMTQEVR